MTKISNQKPDSKQPSAVLVQEISAPRGLGSLGLKEVWVYRDLVFFMFWRQLKGSYRQMALGMTWVVLEPLAQLIMNTFVFGSIVNVPSDGLPYPLFNYAALLPWSFFVACLNGTSQSLLANNGLMKKVYFPRLIMPIVVVMQALFNFVISLLIFLTIMLYYGYTPSLLMLAVPIYLLLAATTGVAIGLWTAPMLVRYRDVAKIIGFLTRGWMYITPVVYASSAMPDSLGFILKINPMTPAVEGFRWAALGTDTNPGMSAAFAFVFMLPIAISGMYYFQRATRSIVDVA